MLYKIKARPTDTEKTKALIQQANKIQSQYAWASPSLEKYQLSIDHSKVLRKIEHLRRQQ